MGMHVAFYKSQVDANGSNILMESLERGWAYTSCLLPSLRQAAEKRISDDGVAYSYAEESSREESDGVAYSL